MPPQLLLLHSSLPRPSRRRGDRSRTIPPSSVLSPAGQGDAHSCGHCPEDSGGSEHRPALHGLSTGSCQLCPPCLFHSQMILETNHRVNWEPWGPGMKLPTPATGVPGCGALRPPFLGTPVPPSCSPLPSGRTTITPSDKTFCSHESMLVVVSYFYLRPLLE